MEYQIGDFSKISRLSIKTLRYYHDYGILNPSRIDNITGYRFYSEKEIEKAKIILNLKDMDFTLSEIKDIMINSKDDADIIEVIKKKQNYIKLKIKNFSEIEKRMNDLLKKEESIKKINLSNEVIIKDIEDKLIVGYRFKGKYNEVGKYFGLIGRYCHINMLDHYFSLYYEMEHREDDADIEACGQVKNEIDFKDLKSRVLTGGRAVTLIHRGSYDSLGVSYRKIIDYINNNNLNTILPIREIYIKGPGFIFKGIPENYITEIQIMLK